MRTARAVGYRVRRPAWHNQCNPRWAHSVAGPRCADVTVAVGISGGVDSAVAAHLLVDQGYRVIGLHVRSWDERDETGQCSGESDHRDAQRICDRLGIPLHDVRAPAGFPSLSTPSSMACTVSCLTRARCSIVPRPGHSSTS